MGVNRDTYIILTESLPHAWHKPLPWQSHMLDWCPVKANIWLPRITMGLADNENGHYHDGPFMTAISVFQELLIGEGWNYSALRVKRYAFCTTTVPALLLTPHPSILLVLRFTPDSASISWDLTLTLTLGVVTHCLMDLIQVRPRLLLSRGHNLVAISDSISCQ